MNAKATRELLDSLREDERHVKCVHGAIDALSANRDVGIRDSNSAHCCTRDSELRNAIRLCLQMEAQRVEAKIKATQERIEGWK